MKSLKWKAKTGRFLLSLNGNTLANGKFDWEDALVDAAISAGIAFFATLGGASISSIPAQEKCVIGLIAAGSQFFLFLALKRGLMRKQP